MGPNLGAKLICVSTRFENWYFRFVILYLVVKKVQEKLRFDSKDQINYKLKIIQQRGQTTRSQYDRVFT